MSSYVKKNALENVPRLDLPKEPEHEKSLLNVAECWDLRLDTPGSASTVSWGVSAQRTPTTKLLTSRISEDQKATCGINSNRNIDKDAYQKNAKRSWVHTAHSTAEEFLIQRDDLYWKRKSELFESILVDQLSRSVLCDPAQDVPRASSRVGSSSRYGSTRRDITEPVKPINLHQTMVNPSRLTVTEAVLDKRIQFDARVISRDANALKELSGMYFHYDRSIVIYEFREFGKNRNTSLPFIERSNYIKPSQNPPQLELEAEANHAVHFSAEVENGEVYDVFDITPGFDLVFRCSEQNCLPSSLHKKEFIRVRIVSIDESAKQVLLRSLGEPQNRVHQKAVSALEKKDFEMVRAVQGRCRSCLLNVEKPLHVVGGMFYSCDRGNGYYTKSFYSSLILDYGFFLEPEELDRLWVFTIFSKESTVSSESEIHFEDFFESLFGGMPENEMDVLRKVVRKLDAAKTGIVTSDNFSKFYRHQPNDPATDVLERYNVPDIKDYFLQRSGSKSREKEVPISVFFDYYLVVSICLNSSDLFINSLVGTWSI